MQPCPAADRLEQVNPYRAPNNIINVFFLSLTILLFGTEIRASEPVCPTGFIQYHNGDGATNLRVATFSFDGAYQFSDIETSVVGIADMGRISFDECMRRHLITKIGNWFAGPRDR